MNDRDTCNRMSNMERLNNTLKVLRRLERLPAGTWKPDEELEASDVKSHEVAWNVLAQYERDLRHG